MLTLLLPLARAALFALLLLTGLQAQAGEPQAIDVAGQTASDGEITELPSDASFVLFETDPNAAGIVPNLPLEEARKLAGSEVEHTYRGILDELAPAHPEILDGPHLYGPFWARIILANSGDETARWRLDAREAYGPSIRVFAIGQAEPQLVLDNRWVTQPISERVPHDRLISSKIIEIAPGGQTELWIGAECGISFTDYPRLVEEERFIADRQSNLAIASLLMGVRIALFLSLIAFAMVLSDRTAFYYSGFHAGLLLVSLSSWGFDSFYLGLSAIEQGIAFRLTWALTVVFYALTVASFLSIRERYPRYARILKASTIVGLVALPVFSMFDANLEWHWARPFVEAVIFLQFALVAGWGVYRGARDRLPGSGWFLFASAMLILFAGMQALYAFQLLPLAGWEVDRFTNVLFTVDGLLFAGALVARAIDIRKQRDLAREEQMQALADRANLLEELDEAKRDYHQASELAEQRRKDLASTNHDLKQPLLSLQMALAKMDGAERATEWVSYIANVLNRNLDETRPAPDEPARSTSLAMAKSMQNAVLMFEDEAAQKGIRITAVDSSAKVEAEPMVQMRILVNLVSNAINHSGGDRIVIGARRRSETLDVIVADNGMGIPADQLESMLQPYRSGQSSSGEGLGLSVVRELVEKNGWSLEVTNLPSGGSVFAMKGVRAG